MKRARLKRLTWPGSGYMPVASFLFRWIYIII